LRVACCGIDAMRTARSFLALTERLGPAGRTIGISEPILEADARVSRIRGHPARAQPARAAGARLGLSHRRHCSVETSSPDGPAARAWTKPSRTAHRAVRRRRRSPLVDLLAWGEADFYSGTFDEKGLQQLFLFVRAEADPRRASGAGSSAKLPKSGLLNVFDLARPPAPDLLVLTTRDRGVHDGAAPLEGRALEAWENEAFLGRLQEGYRQVAAVLRKRRIESSSSTPRPRRRSRGRMPSKRSCRRLALEGRRGAPGG
jgi:hypothetical protein